MEARDWVRVLARRWLIVVLVPVLAAGIAGGLFFLEPTQYRAKATVVVPVGGGLAPSFNVVNQLVADFRGALTSDAVAGQTESETGVPKDEILSGIGSRQLGTSNVVEVVYTGDDPAQVAEVVEKQARGGLAFSLEATYAPASAEMTLAQDEYDAAQGAVETFLQSTGLVIPGQVFRAEARRLIGLRDQLNAAGGDDPELEARIERLQQEATQLVTTWGTLEARRQRALAALAAAYGRFLAAQGQIEAAQQAGMVVPTAPWEVSPVARLTRRVVPAAAVGLVLAVGLVAFLEVIRPTSRPRVAAAESRVAF